MKRTWTIQQTNENMESNAIKKENMNPKKRKLYECGDCNNNKPLRKKRKFNANSSITNERINALIESNKLLKEEISQLRKERDHCKEGRKIYRNELKKLKAKYDKLYLQLKLQNDTNSDYNNEPSLSPTPPPSKYFHKPQKNTIHDNNNNMNYEAVRNRLLKMGFDKNKILNRISLYNGSGETPHFVFVQLLNSFTDNINMKTNVNKLDNLEQHSDNFGCNSNNNVNEGAATLKSVAFEDSYFVSVTCYICKQDFDDMTKYSHHLEQHYKNDLTKTWLKCNFGCNRKAFQSRRSFIEHIAAHTKDKAYKCKMDECGVSYRYKSNIKRHWKSHFKAKQKENKCRKNNLQNQSEANINKDSSESKSGNLYSKSESDEFENSYFISVDCHVCNAHFADFGEYRHHIRKHYINDPNKKWMHCDFGCKDRNNNAHKYNNFICHIASHTKVYPFNCNVCPATSGTKSNLKRHWNARHNTKRKMYEYMYSSAEADDESTSSSQSESESDDSYLRKKYKKHP